MPRLHALILVFLGLSLTEATRAGEITTQEDLRVAVTTGLALIQKAAANYPTHRECFSCHHQTLPMLALTVARTAAVPTDAALLPSQADFTLDSFADKRAEMEKGKGVGGGAMTVGYALWALDLAGKPADKTTEAMVKFLLKTQQPDGRWSTGNRPPLEESVLSCTVIAASGIRRYATSDLKIDAENAIGRAKEWFAKAPTKVQEDRAFQLRGLTMFDGDPKAVRDAANSAAGTQHDDGGWSSRDDLPSDAYATGQTLAALRLAGIRADDPIYRRGVGFLLKTRHGDGSWKVETRSKPIQVFFDNGDPHGKHQFISTPATCWAVVALALALTDDPGAGGAAAKPFDLLIRGGRIVVGRIADGAGATRVIDARGLVSSERNLIVLQRPFLHISHARGNDPVEDHLRIVNGPQVLLQKRVVIPDTLP